MKLKETELYQEFDIYDDDGTKVGTVEIEVNDDTLSRLEIMEPYRNKGYGTAAVKELVKRHGCKKLWVNADNAAAIHVYEKCGFVKKEPTMYLMELREIKSNGEDFIRPIDITLLSIEDYERYQKYIKNMDKWWWLRSPGIRSNNAACVLIGGSVARFGLSVNDGEVAVRPVLLCNPDIPLKAGNTLHYVGCSWTAIAPDMLLCDDVIGHTYFDEESNDYENSHIKQWLHDWAKENNIIFAEV